MPWSHERTNGSCGPESGGANVDRADQMMKFALAVTIWQRGVWQRDYAALIVSEGGETIRVP